MKVAMVWKLPRLGKLETIGTPNWNDMVKRLPIITGDGMCNVILVLPDDDRAHLDRQ